MCDGELIGIVLQQDVVGTRTFSLASSTPSVRFGTQVKSSDYVLSTTPGAQDYLILCYCAADNVFDVVSFTPGYGA
jgi:putative alpha-1,2-mannosidase